MLKKESEEDIYEIPRVIYEEQIHKLMDTQLEFEFYEKQLEASDDAFTNTKAIRYQLEKLEEYLKKIIDEYDSKQGAYKKLSRDTSGVPTKALRRLDGFLSGKEFNADFAKIFSSTAKDIQKEILKNQT